MLMYNQNGTRIIERSSYIESNNKFSPKIYEMLIHYNDKDFDDYDLYQKWYKLKFAVTKSEKFKSRIYSTDYCFHDNRDNYHRNYHIYDKNHDVERFSRNLVWSK